MADGFPRLRRAWRLLVVALIVLALASLGAIYLPLGTLGLGSPRPVLSRVDVPYQPTPGFEQIDLTVGWRFRTDPAEEGLKLGWAAPDHDAADWGAIETIDCWENLGYPGYDGAAWYRRELVVPASWQGKPVYFWAHGVDDELDLYVNGERVAHYGDAATRMGVWDERLATRVDGHLRFGARNVIAARVVDWSGDGGICRQPTILSTSGEHLLSGHQYLARLAELSPGAVWPTWARGGDRAWTVAGISQGPAAAIVGHDGSASPNAGAFSITYWVYDPASGRLIAPESVPVEQRLQDGYQPTPITTWREDGLEGQSVALATDALPPGGRRAQALRTLGLRSNVPPEPTLLYRVALTNPGDSPRKLVVVAALRPYGPNGTLRWMESVEGSGDVVRVNGALALVAERPPAGYGATSLASTDLSALLRRGESPAAARYADPQGLATIGLEYPITLEPGQTEALTFALPMTSPTGVSEPARAARLRELRFDEEALRVRAEWQAKLQRVALNLPDRRYSDAFYASLGYLLANMRGSAITSGPFAHHAMWYRDAAYVLPALLKAGVPEVVPPVVERLEAGQMASGEFPAALELDGRPRFHERHEWDAQGQFAFAVAEAYRLTGDRALLEAAYPAMLRGVDFAVALSRSARTPDRLGTPLYGLLPPGDSAEDLGPREWHHYWDDFWAIGGLREAAGLARALGKSEDAARLEREAAELQAIVLQSIDRVRERDGIDYIPNGPEDTRSSSMARGTTPAVWPLKLFDRDDPLIVRSFQRYDELWVKPQGNAYIHNSGNLWVYGGLEIAHSHLYLWQAGRAAEMAQWVMDNQTLPGTYAWAEAVKPETKRFAGGDMPHSWAAAEYVLYLRDALVREDGDRLILADGVPAPWLQAGQRVEIHRAPTYFGPAGYVLVSHADQGYWDLTIDEGTRAPGGYLLRGPFPGEPKRVVVDGQEMPTSGDGALFLPPGAQTVQVHFR